MKTYVHYLLTTTLALGLGACDDRREAEAPDGGTVKPLGAKAGEGVPTEANPGEADLKIATEIRRLITEDKSLSTAAQGCKIAVVQGSVTLTGLVDTRAERDSIETKARSVEGVVRVDNTLEVKPPK